MIITRLPLSLLALPAILLVAGCAVPGGSSPDSDRDEPGATQPAATPSLGLRSTKPAPAPDPGGNTVTGVLGFDEIEGGCVFLEAADGTRYEVLYPDGWELQPSPLQLVSPNGDVVARGGDEIAVRGSEATDMSSVCQIGPIFRAVEVLSP